MKLRVQHRTEYQYSLPVRNNSNEVRLQPPSTPWQTRGFYLLKVVPSTRLRHYADFHRNGVHHFEIGESHQHMLIEALATVTTNPRVLSEGTSVPFSSLSECREQEDITLYLPESRYVKIFPDVWKASLDLKADSDDLQRTAGVICNAIYDTCRYLPGITTVETTSREFFSSRDGVCQDFAHLMLAMCRSLGMPARYVSGYLYDATRDSLRGAHESHAWVEVFVPGQGWLGYDPTNRRPVDDTYITLAVGRDYDDVAPVKGSYAGAGTRIMKVRVLVERIG